MSKGSVLVAMSGGVDSSVAAALLKQQGFDVTGIGFKLFDNNLKKACDVTGCCGKEGFKHAKNVAGKIGIPFFILNTSKQFRKKVVNYFVDSYISGYTPNPCVICNEKIKFDILLKHADSLKIKYIATGHYAILKKNKKFFELYRANDSKKDQSYFLYTLSQKHLNRTLFPLGKLTKKETRKIAKNNNLIVHDKKESQDICFLKNGSYGEFLKNFSKKGQTSGPIKNKSGKRIGTHKGYIYYTVGQRKGLGISHTHPLYVIEIIPEENTLIVGSKKDTLERQMKITQLKWTNNTPKKNKIDVLIKIRSTHNSGLATLDIEDDKATAIFQKPQLAITPGQSAVFYKRNKVLGGGIIGNN